MNLRNLNRNFAQFLRKRLERFPEKRLRFVANGLFSWLIYIILTNFLLLPCFSAILYGKNYISILFLFFKLDKNNEVLINILSSDPFWAFRGIISCFCLCTFSFFESSLSSSLTNKLFTLFYYHIQFNVREFDVFQLFRVVFFVLTTMIL